MHAVFMPSCAQRIAAVYPAGPAPITTTSYLFAIDAPLNVSVSILFECSGSEIEPNARRLFEQFLDRDQESHRLLSIDQPVIVRQREIHHGPDHDGAILDDRSVFDLVHPENAGLRGIQYRGRQQ